MKARFANITIAEEVKFLVANVAIRIFVRAGNARIAHVLTFAATGQKKFILVAAAKATAPSIFYRHFSSSVEFYNFLLLFYN